MQKITLISVLAILCLKIIAQPPPVIPLKIGDTVPDISLNNIINYSKSSMKLKDFKKPVILDFFATYCSGCIAALPYFNTLQEEFKDSIQIMVVCREPETKIQRMLQTNSLLKNIKLPFITSDTILHNLFPHQTIPHEAWISQEGIIKAITVAEYVNKRNLQKLVARRPLNLPVKSDGLRYDPSICLADNALSMESSILLQSTVTGYINNAARSITGNFEFDDSKYKRYYFINMSPLTLCMSALGYRFPLNRFILEISDSSKFTNVSKQHGWFLTHALSYEVTIPARTSYQKVEKFILNDIGKATNTLIRIEKRPVSCYALVRDPEQQLTDPKSKGGKPEAVFIGENNKPVYIQNGTLDGLIKAMNAGTMDSPQPIIIDETGYLFPVDINLGVINIKDIAAVQKALLPYGFNLMKVSRLLSMVVVTDSHHQNQ